jgi:homogentisate phytyltransferase/homogentisate geranylgeranyltransferase
MKQLKILWQFSRPHTIIGSVCSITALYIMAIAGVGFLSHWKLFAGTLVAALTCNLFIVGINQLVDVELDKINKPFLPLAAGSLSMASGKMIVIVSLIISLLFSFFTAIFLLILIGIILLIGMAYSLPPLQLKRHHLPAALAITIVRGLLVNVGMYLHFRHALYGDYVLPSAVICLTGFIMLFSVAIAWFKDLPDTEGDSRFHISTLAILYSKKNALRGGTLLVALAYCGAGVWSVGYAGNHQLMLMVSHAILFGLFLLNYFSVKLNDPISIRKFYLRFWVFFFAEYILFAGWSLMN